MASFQYRVRDKSGETLNGITIGETQHSAVEHLQRMGYYVLDIREVSQDSPPSRNPLSALAKYVTNPLFFGASTYHLTFFYRQFSTMVKAGMTIGQSLASLKNQAGCRVLRKVAAEALPRIESGNKLSEALAEYPWIFPDLHISLIQAGEAGGRLEGMLERLAEYLERELKVRQKLRFVTFYPKILILAVILIPSLPILIMDGIRPYLGAVFSTLWILGAIVIGAWLLFRLISQLPGFSYAFDMVKLAVPKIGKTVRMLSLAKFYRVLAAMSSAGAPLSQGITHASRASGNWYLGRRLRTAIPQVENGRGLTDSLRSTKVLPHMALDMLATGEQTGNVDAMMDKAAEYFENEAEISTYQITIVLGVLLLLGVALYIGSIVVGFYSGQYANVVDQAW